MAMDNEQQNEQQGEGKDSPRRVFIGVKVGGDSPRPHLLWPRGLFFPLLILFIGVIYLFDQMGTISATSVFHYFWPAIFIFLGLEGILFNRGPGRFWGAFLTLAGGLLVLHNLGIVHGSWRTVWPLLIIFWGLWLLAQALGFPTGCRKREWATNWGERVGTATTDSRCDTSVVFSSMKRRITAKDFQGGRMSAVFGEGDVDLTQADIAEEEAVIHAEAVFGAHKIRVPETWQVLVRGTAVFGEFLDKTDQRLPEGRPPKRLVVKGSAVFGSVVVRN
jgi:predicted membrane protein